MIEISNLSLRYNLITNPSFGNADFAITRADDLPPDNVSQIVCPRGLLRL